MSKRHGHELRVRLLVTPGPTRVQLLVTPGPTQREQQVPPHPTHRWPTYNLRFNVALLIIGDPRGIFFQRGWQAFADHVVSTISGQGRALQTFVCLPTDVEPNAKLSTQQASALHLQHLLRSNALSHPGTAETRGSMHKYGIVSCVVPDDQFAVIPRKFAFAYFDRVERVRLRDGSVAVDYSANEGVQQQQRLLQSANGSSFVAAYGHLSLAAYTGVCQKYTPCWEGCAEGHLGEVLRTRQVPVQVAAFPFATKPHEDTWTWPPRLQVQARSGDDQRTQAPLVC